MLLAGLLGPALVACDGGEGDEGEGEEGEGEEGEGEEGEGEEGEGEGEGPTGALRFNEVGCRSDFAEVRNTGDVAIDGEVYVTDDVADPTHRAAIATPLAAGARAITSPAGFGFACDETLSLVHNGVVVDVVTVDVTAADASFGRLPDTTGAFVETTPTPGAENVAYVDVTAAVFDPFVAADVDARIDITLPEASETSLREDGYTYVEGTFAYTPSTSTLPATGPLTVAFRKKGKIGSFRDFDQKMAWKIDFNRFVDGQTFLGLGKLNLNNLVQDSSTVHEWMAYEMFRRAEVPAPRQGWARVFVNGVDAGPYLLLEALDDGPFLRRELPSTRALFEGEYGEDLFDGSAENFDLDGGDPAAVADLAAFVDAVNAAPAGGLYGAIDDVLDWDQVLRMMATEVFIGHWDGYGPTRNNYYLHLDDDGIWRMAPWGVDQTFDYDWPLYDGQGLLLQGCLADTSCRPLWEAALLQVAADAQAMLSEGFADDVFALADENVIRFADDPRREWDPNNIPALAESAIAFMERRIEAVNDELACTQNANADVDGDGFACSLDCDEGNAAIHFGAAEVCDDRVDQDCNGRLDDGADCPDCVFDDAAGRPLLFCRQGLTYADSVARCEQQGLRLVSIVDAADNDAVFAVARSWFGENAYWIGFDDVENEGVFAWSDGRSWVAGADDPFTAWAPGEPNDSGGEDCAHVWGFDQTWNDIPCDVGFAAVCE
jgi:hypothetical protein